MRCRRRRGWRISAGPHEEYRGAGNEQKDKGGDCPPKSQIAGRRLRPFNGLSSNLRFIAALDVGKEAIAAAVDRLDDLRTPGVVADGLANLLDGRGQDRLRNRETRPDEVEQFVLGDQCLRPLHQRPEQRQRLSAKADLLVGQPESLVPHVEANRSRNEVAALVHLPRLKASIHAIAQGR